MADSGLVSSSAETSDKEGVDYYFDSLGENSLADSVEGHLRGCARLPALI